MEAIRRLTRISRILALALAGLIAVGLPAGYFLLGYQNQRAVLETEAYVNSAFLSRAIASSPEFWQYQDRRLAEVLTNHTSKRYRELRSVVGPDDAEIARAGEDVAPPLLTVSHPLHDAGKVVGRIEIHTSLRPLLKDAALAGGLGLVLGLAVYLTLTIFPFRAVASALRSVFEEKERALAILNNIPDIAWLKDDAGRYIAANEPFARMCGVSVGALPGKTDFELWPQDLAEHYRSDDREVMQTGKPKQVEEPIVDSQGLETWVSTIKTPIFSETGEVIGTTGIARDFTERKRIEEALKEREEESQRRGALVGRLNGALVALAGNASLYEGEVGVAFREITEASARAIAVGRASIWFYTDEKAGIRCLDLYDAGAGTHSAGLTLAAVDYPGYFRELREEYCIAADDAVADPRTREFAESYLKPLGISSMLDVPIRISGQVVGVACHEHVGSPRAWSVEEQSFVTAIAGFTALALEIRQRKRAEERFAKLNEELEQKVQERTSQLLEAQEELVRKEKLSILGQLAGSVGHELRNPLGVMSNAIYYLKLVRADGDETTREYLDLIKHEIDNSQRIISDLLDYARTKTPQVQSVTARRLLEDSLRKCVIPPNVELQTDLPETLPSLAIDPLQVGQVFQNLVTNAVQAMPAGGRVRVSAQSASRGAPAPGTSPAVTDNAGPARPAAEDCVEITVSDTGEGIAPENMRKLFQPLFTTKAKGIGLGLVVCKRLVEANGGAIDVESGPGQGTKFRVTLPITGDRA